MLSIQSEVMFRHRGVQSLLAQLQHLSPKDALYKRRWITQSWSTEGIDPKTPPVRQSRRTPLPLLKSCLKRSRSELTNTRMDFGIRYLSGVPTDPSNERTASPQETQVAASDPQETTPEEVTDNSETPSENAFPELVKDEDAILGAAVMSEKATTDEHTLSAEDDSTISASSETPSQTIESSVEHPETHFLEDSQTVSIEEKSETGVDSNASASDTQLPSNHPDISDSTQETGSNTTEMLDSEGSKNLEEEDSVFSPASLRTPLTDFVDFGKFLKWPEYKDAFDKLGEAARFRHVAAAFSRLRGILPRPPDSFLQRLSKIAIQQIQDSKSNHLARIFYCCGKLRFIDGDLMEAMARKILEQRHSMEMDGCDLSIIVYSIAILSRFQLLVFAAEKGMRVVDLYQLHSKETPPILFPSQPELIQNLTRQMATPNRFGGFREQELSSVAYGCGLLRHKDLPMLKALAREINHTVRLKSFSAQELSNILYGFGLLDYNNDAMLYGISNYLLRTGRIQELETQHLANILYGFSKMGFAYPPILDAMAKEIQLPERLKRFREQELANVVSCAALIGIKNEGLYRALGKEIIKPERLPLYMEHNFSTIVLGLATVGVRDATVLKTLAKEMQRPERVPNYTSKDICDVITGFNNLEFLDDGFMLSLVAELRKPQRITRCDSRVWQSCRAHVFSWSLAFPF